MPERIDGLNAFDLALLKALINLKVTGSYITELSISEKKALCKSFNGKGISVSHNYIVKILPKNKTISINITIETLNELCKILRADYSWRDFVSDIKQLRPDGIPLYKKYKDLKQIDQHKIENTLEIIFNRYKGFKDFEEEIIAKKQGIALLHRPNNNEVDEAFKSFLSRVYIELSTRKAGVKIDLEKDIIEDIYNSWHQLFTNLREELKCLPANCFKKTSPYFERTKKLETLLNITMRNHLTHYQSNFRFWINNARNSNRFRDTYPLALQKKFPEYDELTNDLLKTNNEIIDFTFELKSAISKEGTF